MGNSGAVGVTGAGVNNEEVSENRKLLFIKYSLQNDQGREERRQGGEEIGQEIEERRCKFLITKACTMDK